MFRTLSQPSTARAVLVAALAAALLAASLLLAPFSRPEDAASAASRLDRTTFHDTMRQLWEDHVVWTRMVIVSVVADLPDADAGIARLMGNQDDIGGAIAPYYGQAAGDALSALLREHISGAAALLTAAKAGDATGVEDASAAWYANADAIAAFLAAANPRAWPLAEMTAMMHEHLDLTLAEALARLEGRWADDVAAYDQIHHQILHMADMLSDGVIAQFPGRFSRAGQ